jgi:hypothetical protein
MTSKDDPGNAVSLSWAALLPGIEKALENALEGIRRRAEELAAALESSPRNDVVKGLEVIQEKMGGLADWGKRAEGAVQEADRDLYSQEMELRRQIDALAEGRRRLAEWAGCAI